MTAEEFAKELRATASNPEEMWLYAAMLLFFPIALAMILWRSLNKGAGLMFDQAISNTRQQLIYDNRIKELHDRQLLQSQQDYKIYLVQREKRLQAYEKLKASQPAAPDTSAPALDAPAP
ncbi:MAG: hypothetical protein EBT70_14710 [Betaproteobacteria bacterium]|nr:hypothetical protein [Betaproteobacteria bacterium]